MTWKAVLGLLAALVALLLLGVCGVLFVPVLRGNETGMPLLFWVVLAGVPVLAALFLVWPGARGSSGAQRGSLKPFSINPPTFWGGLLAVFLGLAVAIGLTGYSYTRYQESQQMAAAQDMLSSVADLKVEQISTWYHDRLVDSQTILANRFIQRGVVQFLEEPSSSQFGQDLLEWFSAQAELKHRQVFLYDAQGTLRLSAPPGAFAPKALNHPDFRLALHSGEVIITDLHRDAGSEPETQQDIHLAIWIPIRNPEAAESAAAGVLLLKIDPNSTLFPLIQSWPTDSPTAETLLVRREGNKVVYLNELRHRKGTALNLRMPFDVENKLPAALAVQGKEGIVEGKDYRNIPVLAALREVPGTPWFMVAKIDLDEIRAPMRRQVVTTILVLAALILASALGVGLQGRRRDNEWLRQQLAVEHERKAIAERYILLNKHANDIILLTDRDGRVLEANDRALAAYDRSLEEMKNLTMKDLRAPESGTESIDGTIMESIHRRRDGSCFPVESSTHATDIEGVTYHQSIVRDITERRRAEQELRHTRDYLDKLLNYANAPIIVWDPDLIITRFNHAFERLAGQSAEDMVGRHLSALFPEDSRENSLFEIYRTSVGDHWESVEIPVLRSDGSVRVALWNSANIYGEDGQTLTATIAQGQDITDRKQAALALEQANEELARKNQELEQIVYVASHDLRSPLVNVQGFSAELKAALGELRTVLDGLSLSPEIRKQLDALLKEDLQESLGYILSGIAKMDTLISGLLRLSRLGRAAISIGPVDMDELVAEVARTFEFQIQEAGTTLSIGELPPCLGDAAQLNQAFSNLLGNALKYLDTSRPGAVCITGLRQKGQSIYCVEDNGIGIEARHQSLIFNLYHRLHPGASAGDGLGLTIVRTVLERQHGRVWLESEPGIGTRFYVALPGTSET